MTSSPMVFTTDAAVLLGRAAHDLDADRDLVARREVAEDLEQPRAADDVGEENREFLVLAHGPLRRPAVDYIIRIIGRKLARRPNAPGAMLAACSAGRRTHGPEPRTRQRKRSSATSSPARAAGTRSIPDAATRSGRKPAPGRPLRAPPTALPRLVRDRPLPARRRCAGARPRAALASEELGGIAPALRPLPVDRVNADLYLLEVARHALLAPVRGRPGAPRDRLAAFQRARVLRAQPTPAWLDPTPLHDLLGPRDGRGAERFRRFLEVHIAAPQRLLDQRRRRHCRGSRPRTARAARRAPRRAR